MFGFIATISISFLGGFDTPLKILFIFIGLDILTGIMKGIYLKEITSKISFKGGIKKICILILVGMGVFLDEYLNMNIVRNLVIGYYIGNEGISILENFGNMDMPMPKLLREILVQIKDKNNNIE